LLDININSKNNWKVKYFKMAKNNSLLKIEGTLDNLTFYKSADGHLVRTKGGVSKNRIMNDPAFARTRENGVEFGHSASSGKMLRDAIGVFVFRAKDSKLSSRLMKVMSDVKNQDLVSARGQRNVNEGLASSEGQNLLKGFDFNNRAMLRSVLFAPLTIDIPSGKIVFDNFIPASHLRYPSGASHFSVQSAFLNMDFATGISAVTFSDTQNYPIDTLTSSFDLEPDGVPIGSGTQIYFLLIEFFQEVNGVQYLLNNGMYNVLNILEVI
jgi:hypothetical protein